MPRSWIYRLDRTELIRQLETVGLSTEGNVTDFRQRLSEYAVLHPDYQPTDMPTVPEIRVQIDDPPSGDDGNARTMNQIRKWGCSFEGKDPLAFLERVEELQAEYGFADEKLLRGLPEMLRGDALLWYRNNRTEWRTWENFVTDFREYYLPRRYLQKLKRDIQARVQGTDEPYRKYATDLLTMMRRAGGYAEEEKLDVLYENLAPKYKLYVRRDMVRRTNDLLRNAEEYEHITAQSRERQPTPRPSASTAATAYNRDECCWRCKQRGHTRFECRRIAKRFCSQCGKDGVYTRECHPPPGNAARAGDAATSPRSSV
jgi:hypothetical protein